MKFIGLVLILVLRSAASFAADPCIETERCEAFRKQASQLKPPVPKMIHLVAPLAEKGKVLVRLCGAIDSQDGKPICKKVIREERRTFTSGTSIFKMGVGWFTGYYGRPVAVEWCSDHYTSFRFAEDIEPAVAQAKKTGVGKISGCLKGADCPHYKGDY